MSDTEQPQIDFQRVELDGIRYVILRETAFEHLWNMAGLEPFERTANEDELASGLGLDRESLAKKLVKRRRVSGLSQAELARRAGIRPETLNRIERGRTTPDFATIRKLVLAINQAEQSSMTVQKSEPNHSETNH